jgi:carboxypeptidase Taq
LGYDYDRGRFDETVHPFSVSVGHGDARLCAHLYEDDLLRGLTGTLHEAGHAMYEQGLPQRWRGLGIDAAASYGLHESQSRFWENVIGRSAAFCQLLARETNLTFPDAPARPEQLFGALNRVEPSLIRIFADEVTYNLHIALRYRLERALLSGALPVADLPGAWDDGMEATLGVRPTKLSEGALQDVHWSSGLFGYFPSYTLGNLYAAALRFTMEAQVPTLWDDVARGDLSPALGFLRTHIHDKGHLLDAPALVESVTGPRDLVADLIAHLNQRVSEAYGV